MSDGNHSLFFERRPPRYEIVHANEHDRELLSRVATLAYNETYFPDVCNDLWLNSILNNLSDENCQVLLVKSMAEILGFAKVVYQPASALAYLDKLYVLRAYHQYGIGTRLMRQCMHVAAQQGCHAMSLHVYDQNDKAIRFYQRFGFELGSRERHYNCGIPTRYNDYRMCCNNLSKQLELVAVQDQLCLR